MRVVVQRVLKARTSLDDREVASIGAGLVAFVGAGRDDSHEGVRQLAIKVAHLRIFEHGDSLFGRSLVNTGGEILTFSQMPVVADYSRGRKPNFSRAASSELAGELYATFGDGLISEGVSVVICPFQSRLELSLVSWGPFTTVLDQGFAQQ